MQIREKFLTPNRYSRPGIPLKRVTKIVVHYVGNPNTSAIANHNYFENLKAQIPDKTGTYCLNKDGTYQMYKGQKVKLRWVSSHFLVGLGGEIIQNIPLDEWSYCTNQANGYSISIECCHPDASGKFTAATEKSLAELCAYLCKQLDLDPKKDIIRHYDVTGKQCPLYWSPTKYQSAEVANARFAAFKKRVAYILGDGDMDKHTNGGLPDVPFKVQIIDSALNVRVAPGVSNRAVMVLHGGVYTIIEVRAVGASVWGRLRSKVGWINIGEKYVRKVG